MVKAIIFDVGGVYMEGSSVDFINRSYKILGINKTITSSNGIVFDENYNKGLISHQDCFRKFFSVPISDDHMSMIEQAWTTTWAPTEEMINLVKILKDKYCLLYTSDAADDLLCVDLGGRRIIKKKKQ